MQNVIWHVRTAYMTRGSWPALCYMSSAQPPAAFFSASRTTEHTEGNYHRMHVMRWRSLRRHAQCAHSLWTRGKKQSRSTALSYLAAEQPAKQAFQYAISRPELGNLMRKEQEASRSGGASTGVTAVCPNDMHLQSGAPVS